MMGGGKRVLMEVCGHYWTRARAECFLDFTVCVFLLSLLIFMVSFTTQSDAPSLTTLSEPSSTDAPPSCQKCVPAFLSSLFLSLLLKTAQLLLSH